MSEATVGNLYLYKSLANRVLQIVTKYTDDILSDSTELIKQVRSCDYYDKGVIELAETVEHKLAVLLICVDSLQDLYKDLEEEIKHRAKQGR